MLTLDHDLSWMQSGFAYVHFSTVDALTAALKLDGKPFETRPLRVSRSDGKASLKRSRTDESSKPAAQPARLKALHNNVARVYCKAGGMASLLFDAGASSPSAAEAQHQQLLALTSFCHSQMPRVKALHDNVARVYGKAGGMASLLFQHPFASSQFFLQHESSRAGLVKRLHQAQRQLLHKWCISQAWRSPAQQNRGALR